MRSVTITREELYGRVWTTPKSQLAKEFGISDTGLAKICKRQNVPYPSRGYWARKRAGKAVIQVPLPAGDEEASSPMSISAGLEPVCHPELQGPAQVNVAANLGNPHPIVAAWLAARAPLRRLPELEDRRYRILDAIFRAVQPFGLEPKSRGVGFYFEHRTEKIVCALDEVDRTRRGPEDKLQRATSKRKEKTILKFTIKGYLPPECRLRRNWSDMQHQPLESMCGQIASMLLRAAAVRVRRRQERDAQQQRWHDERRLRKADHDKQQCELARLTILVDQAELHRRLKILQSFLKQLEAETENQSAIVAGRSLSDWFDWAHKIIRRMDPMGDAGRVFAAVAAAGSNGQFPQWTSCGK